MPEHLIFDGHNLAIRCHNALPKHLTDAEGKSTGEAFGFLKNLAAYRKRFPLSKMTVVWDSPSTWRKALFPGYRASRTSLDEDDISVQILRGALPLFGVEQAWAGGEEADDVIGAIAGQSCEVNWSTIVSTDRDLLQLASNIVHVIIPSLTGGNDTLYNDVAVHTTFGVMPNQMVELRALAGDISDEIPGVPQLGLRRAAALLQRFGTLENLYNVIHGHAPLPKHAKLTKLQKSRLLCAEEQVAINIKLMTLRHVDGINHEKAAANRVHAGRFLSSLSIEPKPVLDAFFPRQQSFA